jgi:hypothetical protein
MPESNLGKDSLLTGISVFIVSIALIAGAVAQPNTAPPDLSSNESTWRHFGAELTAVPGFPGPGPVRDDPAHRYVTNTDGGQASYHIADLSDPNLTQWAKDIMKKDNDEVLAGKIAYAPHQSCLPAGVPDFDFVRGARPIYFIQTPREVLMIWEGDHQFRHIYLNVPHSKNPKPSWFGDSVGHYEGHTLVIDTIGQNTRTFVDEYRTPHSDKLHVQERWTLSDDGKTLSITVLVDDPATFKQPWSGTTKFRREQKPMIEYACAENNEHFDFHIPVADKADF